MVKYIDEQYIMKKLKGDRVWIVDVPTIKQVIAETIFMQKALNHNNKSELEINIASKLKTRRTIRMVLFFGGLFLALLGLIGIVSDSPLVMFIALALPCLIGSMLLTHGRFYMDKAWKPDFLGNQMRNVCNDLGINYDLQGPDSVNLVGSSTYIGWGSWSAFGAGVLLSSFSKSRADTKNTAIKWGDLVFRYNQIAVKFNELHAQK